MILEGQQRKNFGLPQDTKIIAKSDLKFFIEPKFLAFENSN